MFLVPLQTFPQTQMAGSNFLLNAVIYNCHGLKSSLPDVLKLCKQLEVVHLQETWLPKQNLDVYHPSVLIIMQLVCQTATMNLRLLRSTLWWLCDTVS